MKLCAQAHAPLMHPSLGCHTTHGRHEHGGACSTQPVPVLWSCMLMFGHLVPLIALWPVHAHVQAGWGDACGRLLKASAPACLHVWAVGSAGPHIQGKCTPAMQHVPACWAMPCSWVIQLGNTVLLHSLHVGSCHRPCQRNPALILCCCCTAAGGWQGAEASPGPPLVIPVVGSATTVQCAAGTSHQHCPPGADHHQVINSE
jgi:hypothetical protein